MKSLLRKNQVDLLQVILNLKHLIKQSAKYATTAQQDTTLAISMRNANYASAYLHAAKDIASDSQIHNSTGIDVRKFKEHITNVQDMVTKKTTDSCPEFSGQVDIYLSEIAT